MATVAGLRRQDWAAIVWMFCLGAVPTALAIRDFVAAPIWLAVGVTAALLARRWSRLYPGPMPHTMRWTLPLSHPGLSPRALHRVLALQPGERMLEIGPGTGHHALPTAGALGVQGRLAVVDIQAAMLNDVMRRAAALGRHNIVPARADGLRLPYRAATFDAAYLVTVLGEIPGPEGALRELARVVRPGGRIVVGEMVMDPDYVAPAKLREMTAAAGLHAGEARRGPLSYLARLDVPPGAATASPRRPPS